MCLQTSKNRYIHCKKDGLQYLYLSNSGFLYINANSVRISKIGSLVSEISAPTNYLFITMANMHLFFLYFCHLFMLSNC